MVCGKAKAWVTSAVCDESVSAAQVLANSIRKTKTNYQLAVITSMNVSLKNRISLKTSFDILIFLEGSGATNEFISGKHANALANAFTFDLVQFEKCIFISPNSIFLENADNLFQSTGHLLQTCGHSPNETLRLSVFAVEPDRDVWNRIWKNVGGNNGCTITDNWLGTWLLNQKAALNTGTLPNNMVAEFSVSKGKLLCETTHSPIITFTCDENPAQFYLNSGSITLLQELNLGLHEKLIIRRWEEIRQESSQAASRIHLDSFSDIHEEKWKNEPIAIVGMSCRYPGANSLQEFWKLLFDGEEGIREPPAFRWTKEHAIKVNQQDRKSQAGFLSTKVDEFDARFFGLSPKEAAYMDPQTRLLHEVLWESLENAGINPLSLYGSYTGIFTGSWMNDYKDIVASSAEKDFFRTYMGNSIGAAAARLSFLLGLTGPSIATESGCSSAIVAVDLAVKSLRNGETNLALAGGVNLLLHPFNSAMMEYVISPNGRCKTFDANADGFGRAEGCGVLVLKRMSDALRDRDNIWAIIRGSAVSQEGVSRSLGTPTVHCEALAMKLALEDAKVRPERVSFVETHGTGTSVGDPMEVAAIANAYHTPHRKEPLIIGSVKTNVGHTESCSGITGIMKAVLALQHEVIPKHLNLETLNPEIFLDSIPAMIPLEPKAWPKVKGHPRICGVSSFGITGTDGHVIVQEAPENKMPRFTLGMERPLHILKISGKSGEAMEELLTLYENLLCDAAEEKEFADIAYSANSGRASFNHRAFLIAKDSATAVKILKEKKYLQAEANDGNQQQICFLFTGQGSQYAGMAKTLYETSPAFRVTFDACDRTLQELYNLSIKQVLWESDPNSKELSRTIYSQTSIFCVEYCLLRLWQSWGIKPTYVLGHSLGEFCAAVAADILSFEDALKLVAERSRLIDNLPKGSMLVIKASKPEVDELLLSANVDLDFAAVNNPEQTVVAGDTKLVSEFLQYLKGQGVKAIILEATHAFHSRHMDPMLEKYRKIAKEIKYKQGNPNVQYISGMEGRLVDNLFEMGADYWVRHTREKVSFTNACEILKEVGCQDFLEVGPQPVLSSFVMMNNEGVTMNCFPSLRRGADNWETMLTSLGKLYLLGYQVDWKQFDEPYVRHKVSLPFHPFHRKSFWVECPTDTATMIHPLIGYPLKNASALNIFQNDLVLKSVPYLKDHCIGNRVVFPGAAFTEMCFAAGHCVANGLYESFEQPSRAIALENFKIEAPLELKEGKSCRLQVLVDLPDNDTESLSGFRVKVYHQNANNNEESGKWVLHATSTLIPAASTKDCLAHWNAHRIPEIISAVQPNTPQDFYKIVDEQGLKFGETFRMIQRYWTVKQLQDTDVDRDEVVTEIGLPQDWNKYLLHPLIIDAVFQTGILTRYNYSESKLQVPVNLGKLVRFPASENESSLSSLYMHVIWKSGKYHLYISTPNWEPVAYVEDVQLIETNVKTIESVLEQQCSAVPDAWEEAWKVIPAPFNNAIEHSVNVKPILEQLQVASTPKEDVVLYQQTKTLLYLYVLKAFYELGWQPKVNDKIRDVKAFCRELDAKPEFHQLIRFYFGEMEKEAGFIHWNNTSQSWNVSKVPPSRESVLAELKQMENILKATKVGMITGIYTRIADYLPKVLKGEESALALLFPQEAELQQYSADSYYQNWPGREECLVIIRSIIRPILRQTHELNHHNPGQVYRVLEVGAGTGSLTADVLQGLRDNLGNINFEYYYTDISQMFFIKAEKRFEDFAQNIKYAVFNIEESPLSQGIPLEYFDLVVCTDVLHATRNLEESLIHLRQTLRPEGVLFFTETIIQARDITFVFGLLEGYWRFQDFSWRPHHCCVSAEIWKELLTKCGFQSAHCVPGYAGEMGMITAVAAENLQIDSLELPNIGRGVAAKKEWMLFADSENFGTISHLANMLHASDFNVTLLLREDRTKKGALKPSWLKRDVTWKYIQVDAENGSEIEAAVGKEHVYGVVYGWGINHTELDQKHVSLPFMHLAKTLVGLEKPPQLFVVTQGVLPVVEDQLITSPTAATLLGMTKSLKNENASTLVRFVDLERDCSKEIAAKHLLYEMAMCKGSKEQQRVQVAYRGNVRYEPKFVQTNVQSLRDVMKLPPSTDRYHLKLPETRLIQDLEFESLEESSSLEENELEIKVKAFALNFRDVFTVLKPSKEFENLNAVGLDVAGVVTKVGSKCKRKVGEKVFGVNFKGALLPSHLVTNDESVLCKPDGLTYCEAVTLPAVFLTAYHCLITVAKMKKDDTVLIHTGSGGVGLAAIQLTKHVGATIITTAGNPRKRAYLRSLGIEHVFHSRDTSYEQDILRVTNGKGVDVVLNSITGPGIKEATLRATARNGRWVEMSKLSVWTPEEVEALRPDVFYKIEDLTVLDKAVFSTLLERMQQLLADGIIRPIPFVRFDALGLRQAMQYLQKAKHIGKVVVTMPEVNMMKGQFQTVVPLFDPGSTYLITGGLGGIGFEVCKWMLGLGATDLVLCGRSLPKPEVEREIESLKQAGYNINVLLGDVGDFNQCRVIIEKIKQQMKPLRGVMHCAGVLRDNAYSNQTWPQFEATFTPKVMGTWNLHQLTRDCPLEYFVMYSSVTALLGTLGQPNHAAANSFEDVFIHYRQSLGFPGTTINWGQWAQVGCAKDVSLSGVLPVSVKRMLNGLEMALRTQKRQVCFSEFDSFQSLTLLSPLFKGYLDDRLWKQSSNTNQSSQTVNAEQFWKEMDGEETKVGKEVVMATHLKNILRSALRLEPSEPISDDANLQELGVDSLMMIELKNSIQSLLGSRLILTTGLLKNCNTIRLLAEVVVGKLVDGAEEEEEQIPLDPLPASELLELLQNDSILPADIIALPECTQAVRPSLVKSVLVTGATGQLGQYIVSELIKNYDGINNIVCLVRGDRAEERLQNVLKQLHVDTKKVECVSGDVTKHLLGLSVEVYEKLTANVDAVIHCAAKMHPGEQLRVFPGTSPGTDCRSVNLTGTLHVLKFASSRKIKHVYFPSTLVTGALTNKDTGVLSDLWPEAGEINSIVSSKMPGLQSCKFLGERLMDQANQRGIPCKVFRFPWIAGESETGKVSLHNLYMLRFLSYLKAGAMPSSVIPANFLPVNICAEISLKLFFRDDVPNEVFNLSHPKPQLEQEFVRLAKDDFGKELEVLEWQEFEERLRQIPDKLLQEELKGNKMISQQFTDAGSIAVGYINSPETFFSNKKISSCIPNYGEEFPPTMEILRKDLRYLKTLNVLTL